jgi:hypothetical protein
MTATAAETPQRAGSHAFPNGGFTLNKALRAKPPKRDQASIRSSVPKIVRELALRASAGDEGAQRDLYLLHGTLRAQAALAKRALNLPRNQTQRDSPELGAAAGRMLRGLADRAGEGDLMALHELAKLRSILRDHTTAAARALNRASATGPGYSWREIGQAVGTTMQAAQQRFGEK